MSVFTFPNPVNDKVARTVAACVLVTAVVAVATHQPWLSLPLAVGFALRAAFGPRVSPFAVLASRVVAPRLGAPHLVPGPPKRFAQAIGLVVTGTASVLWLAGAPTAATIVLAVIIPAAGLESLAGFCLGCWMFGLLMRGGLIPRSVCLSCANVAYEG
ncbi:MAG: hypothetical protein JWM98_2528 [Thermoleophilia bacterium]|nr:hypothetical protein [Thermoleophilia bacterium]